MNIVVIANSDLFWQKIKIYFTGINLSGLIKNDKNRLAFKDGTSILKTTNDRFEVDTCGYGIDFIIYERIC